MQKRRGGDLAVRLVPDDLVPRRAVRRAGDPIDRVVDSATWPRNTDALDAKKYFQWKSMKNNVFFMIS